MFVDPAALYALASAALLALRDVFGRLGVRGVDPISGSAFTALVGLPVLWGVSFLLGDFSDPWPGWAWPLLFIGASGILRVFIARTMLLAATQYVGAARASAVSAANLLFAVLLGVLLLGERLTLPVGLGAALVFAGYAFISGSRPGGRGEAPGGRSWVGMGLALGCAAAFGAGAVFARPAVGFFTSANEANFYSNLFAVLPFLPFLARRGVAGEIRRWSARSLGFLLLAGVSASLGVTFLYLALAHAPVVHAFPISQSRPLFAVAIARVFLQSEERVNRRVLAGAGAIFAGTLVLIFRG